MTAVRLFTVMSALCALGSVSEAAKTWIEVKSPHFTIVSADSERGTRNVIWEFEQVRSFIESTWPWARVDIDKPFLIIAVPNRDDMTVLVPELAKTQNEVTTVAFMAEGLDRNYIALRSDVHAGNADGINSYYYAYQAYLHLVLRNSARRPMPPWFEQGLVSIFSNTSVRESEIQMGRMVPWHIRQLRQHARLPLRELIAADRSSPWLNDIVRRPTFEAESWALLHMLIFGAPGTDRASRVDDYADRMRRGEPSLAAFEAVFGNIAPLDDEFAKYLQRPLLTYSRAKIDLRVDREKLPSRAVPASEAMLVSASFHAATGKVDLAQTEVDRARIEGGSEAALHDLEGILFERARDMGRARAAYLDAVAAGSTNHHSYCRLATMNSTTGADASARVIELLDRCLVLNPQYAPGFRLRSRVEAQLGRKAEALRDAARAASLEPFLLATHLDLAWRLSESGRTADANDVLRQARAFAETDAQKQELDAVSARLAGAAPSTPAAAPVVRNQVVQPTITKQVTPVYPPDAVSARVQGEVTVQTTITPDGHVADAKIVKSVPLLDQAALNAVRQWEYAPTIVEGRPVQVIVAVTLNFKLP